LDISVMRFLGKQPARCRRNRLRPRGFTLIEAAMTAVIVGVGVLAAVELMAACSQQNRAAAESTTAMLLANNVQEAVAHLPFSDPSGSTTFGLEETGQPVSLWDDVDDFDGKTFCPPLDAGLLPLPDLAKYSQEITVKRCDPQKLTLDAAGADAARVTVRVLFTNRDGTKQELHRLTWVRVRE
jgi:prepilin-type N-terminal cleavage/methylation domain-containing protein